MNKQNILKSNNLISSMPVKASLIWTIENIGDNICATSSFQTQSLPFLHQISIIIPKTPIIFIDTGFHFPETLNFRDQITDLFNLNTITTKPFLSKRSFQSKYGLNLHKTNPKLCCNINKVVPFKKAISKYDAWLCGIRKDQTMNRSKTRALSMLNNGTLKICPMLLWKRQDIYDYIEKYDLPKHPLHKKGYTSIGCKCCTEPIQSPEHERDGRWRGNDEMESKECGIHMSNNQLKANLTIS